MQKIIMKKDGLLILLITVFQFRNVILSQHVECNNPVIILNFPDTSKLITSNSKGYIEMQIMDEQSIVFKINDQAVPSYNYSPNNGKFSSMLHLKPGANIYVVIATNSCGSTSQEISIIYEPNKLYKKQ